MYMPHMSSLQPKMQLGKLIYIYSTLLAYAPEQNCLPHHTYVPLHYFCSLHIDPTLLHIQVQEKSKKLQLVLPCNSQICASKNMFPKYHICPLLYVQISDQTTLLVYMPHEFTVITNLARSTGIHISHIIGICPYTNMPIISYVCPTVSIMHSTCRTHITAHTSQNKNWADCNFIYHNITIHVQLTNMPPTLHYHKWYNISLHLGSFQAANQ